MHSSHRGHLTEAIWEVVQFLDAVCEPYGKLLGEKLGGTEEGTWSMKDEQRVGEHLQHGHAIQFSGMACINLPTEGFSPNCTIWRRETPVAGNLAKWAILS